MNLSFSLLFLVLNLMVRAVADECEGRVWTGLVVPTSNCSGTNFTVWSGMVVREVDGPYYHGYSGPLKFTSSARADFHLRCGGRRLAIRQLSSPPSSSLAKLSILGVTDLPFNFSIMLPTRQLQNTLYCDRITISISMMQDGACGILGDLKSKYSNSVARGGESGLEIKVTGLEYCNSPGAGGFCTDKKARSSMDQPCPPANGASGVSQFTVRSSTVTMIVIALVVAWGW